MKCQILFSGKNKKNISKCRLLKILPRRLLKILPRVLSVKHSTFFQFLEMTFNVIFAYMSSYNFFMLSQF